MLLRVVALMTESKLLPQIDLAVQQLAFRQCRLLLSMVNGSKGPAASVRRHLERSLRRSMDYRLQVQTPRAIDDLYKVPAREQPSAIDHRRA